MYWLAPSLNLLLFSDSGISCCSDYQEIQPALSTADQGEHLGTA